MGRRWGALVVSGVLLAGCGGGDDAADEDDLSELEAEGVVTTTTIDRALIGDLPDATAPLAELTAAVGTPLILRNANVTFESISVEVRNKENPDNLDRYSYVDGEWSPPSPVSLNVKDIERLEERVFDATEVNWAAITGLGKQAIESLDPIEQPSVSSAAVSRAALPDRPESFLITIPIQGERGRGQLVAEARTGNVISSQRL